MPRRTIGPFPALANLPVIDVNTAEELDILERCDLINSVLADASCNCNGHAAGNQRDPYWGGDLSELVCRCTPHDIRSVGADGVAGTQSVSIKIHTLQIEIDSNNEICAWVYEES